MERKEQFGPGQLFVEMLNFIFLLDSKRTYLRKQLGCEGNLRKRPELRSYLATIVYDDTLHPGKGWVSRDACP